MPLKNPEGMGNGGCEVVELKSENKSLKKRTMLKKKTG